MKYFPLLNYTHYSLQRAFSKPEQLAKKCKQNGYLACGIADYKSISGVVAFYKACTENGIKPIIGCTFDGFTLFAKNKSGWLDLIQIVSLLDDDLNFDYSALTKIANHGNLLCVAKDESKSPIQGADFYTKSEAFEESYYVEKKDAVLHRVLLCSAMKTTLPKINTAIKSGKTVDNQVFFESDTFYIPDQNESSQILINDIEGCKSLEEIHNKCEHYNILNQPMLPRFPTPNNESEEEYLKELCRVGWRNLLIGTNKIDNEESKKKYLDRFNKEFEVIKKANLFGYFLIVQDIIKHVQSEGCLTGPGRGSAAGCLISYLIGVTQVDPIEFDLLFERFYSDGRNIPTSISFEEYSLNSFRKQ
jgi:DNA polymerase-3 subunit alpha